jgi:hypothetical protein
MCIIILNNLQHYFQRNPPAASANQRWRYDPNTEALISHHQNLAIDVEGGNSAQGTHAIVWNPKGHHDNKNQR